MEGSQRQAINSLHSIGPLEEPVIVKFMNSNELLAGLTLVCLGLENVWVCTGVVNLYLTGDD